MPGQGPGAFAVEPVPTQALPQDASSPQLAAGLAPYWTAVGQVAGSGTSRVYTISNPTKIGDTLLVDVTVNNATTTVSAVTDSAGNVYTLDASVVSPAPQNYAYRSAGATGGPGGGQTAALVAGATMTVTTAAVSGTVTLASWCLPSQIFGPLDVVGSMTTGSGLQSQTASATPTLGGEIAVVSFMTQAVAAWIYILAPYSSAQEQNPGPLLALGYNLLGTGTGGVAQTSTAAWDGQIAAARGVMWVFRVAAPAVPPITVRTVSRFPVQYPARQRVYLPVPLVAAPAVAALVGPASRPRVPVGYAHPMQRGAVPGQARLATRSPGRPRLAGTRPTRTPQLPSQLRVSGPVASGSATRAHPPPAGPRPVRRTQSPVLAALPPVAPVRRRSLVSLRSRPPAQIPPPLRTSGPLPAYGRPSRALGWVLRLRPIRTITIAWKLPPLAPAHVRPASGQIRPIRAGQLPLAAAAPPAAVAPKTGLPARARLLGYRWRRPPQLNIVGAPPPLAVVPPAGLPARARLLVPRWRRAGQARLAGAAPPAATLSPAQTGSRARLSSARLARPRMPGPVAPPRLVVGPRLPRLAAFLPRRAQRIVPGPTTPPPSQLRRALRSMASVRRAGLAGLPPPSIPPAKPPPMQKQGARARLVAFVRTVRHLVRQITGAPPPQDFPGSVTVTNFLANRVIISNAAPDVAITDRAVYAAPAITNRAAGSVTVTNRYAGRVGVINFT